MEDRIVSIEEKIAFLEKTVADLDEVVREISGRLGHVGETVEDMKKAVARMGELNAEEDDKHI